MKDANAHFRLTDIISILFGIVLPLVFGVKDLRPFAVLFAFVWLVYAITLFIWVFPVTGRRNLKRRLNEAIPAQWEYS
jgi:uncharacterized membrane protein YwaF